MRAGTAWFCVSDFGHLYYFTRRLQINLIWSSGGKIQGHPRERIGKMEKTRLEFLQETLAADPDNTFIRYGLAMELQNSGRAEEAWTHFEYLLTRHPEYSATYFQAGVLLEKLGRRDEARRVFEQGIDVTGRQGKSHAQSELRAALDELVQGG